MRRQNRQAARPGIEPLETRVALSIYFVSNAGSDEAAGDMKAPWKTLQRAVKTVQPGDTVVVRTGKYEGFDLRHGGTADAPIRFLADSNVVINLPSRGGLDGINLEGADYVDIEGFSIVGMPRTGIRSVLNRGVTIRGNTLDRNGTWGILTGWSEDVTIEGNVASRSREQHGIYVSNSADNPTIRNNVVWGNGASGIQINADRYARWAGASNDGIVTGAVIQGNIVYGNGKHGGAALNLDGVQGSVITNNLLYDNHGSGIVLYMFNGAEGSKNNVVSNNTVIQAADARWALLVQAGSTGNTLVNNILINTSDRGAMNIATDSLEGLVSDFNLVTGRYTTDDNVSQMTLSQWRALTGQDLNSFVAGDPAPIFLNASGRDFRLAEASPAVDAGTALGAPVWDLLGNARPSGAATDIGAYEFVGPTAASVFDFGTTTSPTATGYIAVSNRSFYTGTEGFGWVARSKVAAGSRWKGDDLTRDYNATAGATFVVDASPGEYDVTVTMGDTVAARDRMATFLEGVKVAVLDTNAGEVVTRTFRVRVVDGQLTLRLADLGGADGWAVINALRIAPVIPEGNPKVVGATPTASPTGLVDGLTLTFDRPMRPSSFTLDDVLSLTGPGGAIVPTQVRQVDAYRLEVVFPPQDVAGDYRLVIGSDIVDVYGRGMDPGGIGVFGDLSIGYVADFVVAATSASLDFGTAASPIEPGSTRVTDLAAYGPRSSFGWVAGAIRSGDRKTGDAFNRDYNATVDGTFGIDVVPGVYDVTIVVADMLYAHTQPMEFRLEGNVVEGGLTLAKGVPETRTYRVAVPDGRLELRLRNVGSAGNLALINALRVLPVS